MKLITHLLMIVAFFALVYGQSYPATKFSDLKKYISQADNSANTFATLTGSSTVTANVISNVKSSLNGISNNFYDAISIINAKDGTLSSDQASTIETLLSSINSNVNSGVSNLIKNKTAYQSANGLETISEQLNLLDSGVSGFITAILDILPTSSQAAIKSTGQQIGTNANKGCVAFGGASC